MKDFTITVKKLTDADLMREACEMTFIGKSGQSLLSMYKSEHSPCRTQLFWITLHNIPLFVSTHILRHHVGLVPFQLTCRDDRKGGNPGLIFKAEEMKEQLRALSDDIANNRMGDCQETIGSMINEMSWMQENTDRYTPVNLGLCINAQSLIDMAKLRLCQQAHWQTVTVFKALKAKIAEVDPDLATLMVPKCVYRNGLCGEPRCCGYNTSETFKKTLKEYLSNFTNKQKGAIQ
jgi:hypothetical protein